MLFRDYIWDFDGTLVDTYPHEFAILWDVMKRHHIDSLNDPELVYRQMRVAFLFIHRMPGMTEEIFEEFSEIRKSPAGRAHDPQIVSFPDSATVLGAVIEKGGRNFLCTHRDGDTLSWFLGKNGLDRYFTDILDADEDFPMKPNPEGLTALCLRNSIDPSEAIMIGDRIIDGLTGLNAGMSAALVNYPAFLPDGRSPAEDAAAGGVKYIANSLTELARLLEIL
jgi:phosphoglycolate phosphatase-like HAD superfamily hydrolase